MTFIKTLKITLKTPNNIILNQSIGSVMQGVLMDCINSDYASFLHQQSLHPYSQYCYFDKTNHLLHWTICALNTQAINEILLPLSEIKTAIFLRKKRIYLNIINKNYDFNDSYENLAETYFQSKNDCTDISYQFITSTGFKNNNSYVIFPTPQLIFNSLLRKWNTFAGKEILTQRGLSYDLAMQVYVKNYSLALVPFHLEGKAIPAFKGKYDLGISQKTMAKNIIYLLSKYASYSGIGIKTSIGMGATRTNFHIPYAD